MLDLGRSLLATVSRAPDALSLVDGDTRLSYAQLYRHASALVSGLEDAGVRRGDRILTALQNNRAAIWLHWACQLAGVTIVPVNWRATADEIDFLTSESTLLSSALERVRR